MRKVNPKEIVLTFKLLGSISATAKVLEVSRNTVKFWLRRARTSSRKYELSSRSLTRKSTRPKSLQRKLDVIGEIRLVELRKLHRYDQIKLASIYASQYGIQLSPKTCYNILKRRAPELIQSKPKHRRPKFQNGSHMRPANTSKPGYIQADTKHVTPELSGLEHTTYEIAFIDIYSRYKVAWIMPNLDQEAAITALRWMIKAMPCRVKFIQTDNGWEFGARFHAECEKLGIEHYHIHKSSPNENAVIERSFRTDQDEFFYYLERRPADINELNLMFQQYLKKYNTFRPHLSLNLQTPLEVIQSAT